MLKKTIAVFSALVAAVALAGIVQAADLSAEEIVKRLDANEYMSSAHVVSKMIIKSGRREMVKEMESWSVGKEKALAVFNNASDKGTKYLKLKDELWMFFPNAEDLVKISGHMLKQGMMGSDFSYEDALESEKMGELYKFKLLGKETLNGATCYVLEATALPGKTVSYPTRKIWVDAANFVSRKEELYAASGKLMKVSTVEAFLKQDGRTFPSKIVMEDKMKRDSSTTLIIERIEFNVKISDDMFSLRSLMR